MVCRLTPTIPDVFRLGLFHPPHNAGSGVHLPAALPVANGQPELLVTRDSHPDLRRSNRGVLVPGREPVPYRRSPREPAPSVYTRSRLWGGPHAHRRPSSIVAAQGRPTFSARDPNR